MKRLKKQIAVVLMLVLAVGLMGFVPQIHAADATTMNVTGTYGQTEARTMLNMINAFRASDAYCWNETNSAQVQYTGLSSLEYDYNLEKIAMQRAMEIAIKFDHVRPNGTMCWTAFDESGYVYMAKSENIAMLYTTATDVFEGWKEESEPYAGQGHRRNMLDKNVTAVGVGHVVYNGAHYWVQNFGSPKSSMADPGANDSSATVSISLQANTDNATTATTAPTTATKPTTASKPTTAATTATTACKHSWKETSRKKATALATGTIYKKCTRCGATTTQTIAKLKPLIKLSATNLPLQIKKSTTALKVTSKQTGDYVASYKSSNTKIATVNSKGKITAKKKTGKAIITVKLKSGKTAKCTIKVQKGKVKTTKVKLTSSKVTLAKGKKATIKVTLTPLTSQEKTTFKSSNKKIATVNSKGVVTAKKKGKAKITVKSGKKKTTYTVTVK